ncbi:putative asparagine synthase [Sugiyamaella lignohabitans]|uniref:Putative asparagine synthase n=1 Tax=Sugiyamaella lignohabitans TaxID=796027 RepID=A0A167D7N8_9ASCO|nr:putative asparagine synthase [Sugiyamaella lignohabitans]ANB12582.1 putative asparagine synthase [Sugiyamaella lignohabitans]
MCGILLSAILDTVDQQSLDLSYESDAWKSLIEEVTDRGPSSNNDLKCSSSNFDVKFFSSVLALRSPYTAQPITGPDGHHIFQFNGELYNDELFGEGESGNDAQYMYNLLTSGKKNRIVDAIQKVRGEYAFTYYDELDHKIWFGRDCIGRRSLLYSYDQDLGLIVTSVPPDQRILNNDRGTNVFYPLLLSLKEVPAGILFCLDLKVRRIIEMPWAYLNMKETPALYYPYSMVSTKVDGKGPDFEILAENALLKVLSDSVSRRVKNIPEPKNVNLESLPHIAILFSGGLDCTLLALLVDKLLPSKCEVDLLNVSFENKRTGKGYDTPDRVLGRRSWAELYESRDNKSEPFRFRFVEINVSFDEMIQHRPKVQSLMWPKDTVMDLSIAIAFYFASRGQGSCFQMVQGSGEPVLKHEEYTSKAPVLLSGLGADELFGGYTRHTTRLRQQGYQSLSLELQLDFSRLHERNLGRDDRVCGNWGKELRYPFLDEKVVEWAMDCPLRLKVYHPPFVNDVEIYDEVMMQTKYILRLLAKSHSLLSVSKEKKRAIQFGAKTAKMDIGEGKSRGTDRLTPLV